MDININKYDYYTTNEFPMRIWCVDKKLLPEEAPTFAPDDWEPRDVLDYYKWDEDYKEWCYQGYLTPEYMDEVLGEVDAELMTEEELFIIAV